MSGRLIQKTLPGTQFESMVYNPDGTLYSQTDFNNHLTRYGYDAAGRLNLVSHSDGSSVSNLYYPDGTVHYSVRTPVSGPAVTTSNVYDPNRGFLTSRTTQYGSTSNTISYAYDDAGNKTSVTMPSGTVGYQYDADDRLSIVTHKDSTQTKYGYDKVGNRTSVARPNGVLTSYAYDDLNRLTNLTNYTGPTGSPTVISSYEYQLDNAGRRTKVAESGPSSQNASTSYAYDDDGRLTNETGPAGNISYYYDNVGNRTSKVVTGGSNAGTTTYQYDTGGDDRLTGESARAARSPTATISTATRTRRPIRAERFRLTVMTSRTT